MSGELLAFALLAVVVASHVALLLFEFRSRRRAERIHQEFMRQVAEGNVPLAAPSMPKRHAPDAAPIAIPTLRPSEPLPPLSERDLEVGEPVELIVDAGLHRKGERGIVSRVSDGYVSVEFRQGLRTNTTIYPPADVGETLKRTETTLPGGVPW